MGERKSKESRKRLRMKVNSGKENSSSPDDGWVNSKSRSRLDLRGQGPRGCFIFGSFMFVSALTWHLKISIDFS